MSRFHIGDLIDERYEVLSILGEGGMGLVYKVNDLLLSQPVALKTLLPDFIEHEEALLRFINEAKVSLKLSHPNIIRVYDIRRLDKLYYMTMEYIDGISLQEWLRKKAERNLEKILGILEKICAGLEYAHRMGTFHRDIKPSNIMLTKDDRVLLLDFGLAKLLDGMGNITRLGGAGTPNYMAPEQKRGGKIDQRVDIFSVGILAFQMLTGELPKLSTASQLNPILNADVDRVLAKAIAVEPHKRHGNILIFFEELKDALTRTIEDLGSQETLVTLASSGEKLAPRAKKGKKPASLSDMVLVPEGHFWMGSSHEESKSESEKPRHRVYLPTYYIDKSPVTNQAYYRFIKETGHSPPLFWSDPRFNDPLQPVVGVSWYDAVAFAKWSEKRLPTEAEWEKAAKGGKDLIYPWGNTFFAGMANVDFCLDQTSQVEQFLKGVGGYGCYDMIGNVWEWCSDWYDEKYYSMSLIESPEGPGAGEKKVIKGGAWDTISFNARNAFRFFAVPDTKSPNIGFRCVLDG